MMQVQKGAPQMNEGKPGQPDEMPIEQSPGRGTLGQPPMGGGDRLYLSASQINERGEGASWKAPAEKRGLSTGALIALLVVLVIVLLVALRFAGVY
jgi:hypothetical protein